MSDSTQHLDLIAVANAQQAVAANEMFDAASPATAFGRRASTTSALQWGHYGVSRWYINETATPKANGTVTLTASSTRYVALNRSLAVAEHATAFPADKLAAFRIVVGASAPTSFEDHRDPHHTVRFLYGRTTIAMGGANKTLTYEQAMCDSLVLTGNSASLLDVIVPAVPRDWKVFANTTGGGGIRVKTASGAGVTVADGKRCIVECDGTDVVRITPDT